MPKRVFDLEEEYVSLTNPNFKRKKNNKFLKVIYIFFSVLLMIILILFSTDLFLYYNSRIVIKRKKNIYSSKMVGIKGFVSVYTNGTKGPITSDRSKDDGRKANIYNRIINIPDNDLETFYYDYEGFKKLDNILETHEEYICQLTGYKEFEITCPLNYHIVIEKAFYGRYIHDTKHCIVDIKVKK